MRRAVSVCIDIRKTRMQYKVGRIFPVFTFSFNLLPKYEMKTRRTDEEPNVPKRKEIKTKQESERERKGKEEIA
ncbi:MAG: hypothetical protein JSY10_05770 [Paenibacillus sp.]|nr:hypothetical protein [Paenibacillus sp.]